MADNEALQWRQVSPGRYERGTDIPEQFYTNMARLYQGTGHTFFAINAAVEIQSNAQQISEGLFEVAFREAWQRLRFQFPTIASKVEYDPATKTSKKIYNVPQSEEEVKAWLDNTFFLETGSRTARDSANEDTPLGEYASLHFFRHKNEDTEGLTKWTLLFRSHHDIVDGLGTFRILNHLFTFAAEYIEKKASNDPKPINFAEEFIRLSLPLQIQANISEPTEHAIAKLKADKGLNEKNRAELPILCYPGEVTATKSAKSHEIGTRIPVDTSKRILNACKIYGITATHLFHAAIGLALRALQPRSDKDEMKRYMTYALVDLRKVCPGSEEHPASILHTVSTKNLVLDLVVPASSDEPVKATKDELVYAVNALRDWYKTIIIDKDFLSTVPTVLAPPSYAETILPVPPPDANRTVSLSSLGLIDSLLKPKHGPFEIGNPWVLGAEYGTGLGVFFGTFAGEIHVWAGYNEAFHVESDVKEYLELVGRLAVEIVDVIET
jgi:hypothetical protein